MRLGSLFFSSCTHSGCPDCDLNGRSPLQPSFSEVDLQWSNNPVGTSRTGYMIPVSDTKWEKNDVVVEHRHLIYRIESLDPRLCSGNGAECWRTSNLQPSYLSRHLTTCEQLSHSTTRLESLSTLTSSHPLLSISPARMETPSKAVVPMLVGFMLLTGVCNTLLTKYQVKPPT